MSDDSQISRKQQEAEQQQDSFYVRLRNLVTIFTGIIAGGSAVFILVSNFLFAYEAYQISQAIVTTEDVFQALLVLICKFCILLLFTLALVMGSLVPLALMYIIIGGGPSGY